MSFKKLLITLPMLALGVATDATAGNCRPMSCDIHKYDSSELLETINGYTRQNLGGQNNKNIYSYFEGKKCFYCGTKEKGSGDGCNFGDIVIIPSGANIGAYNCYDDTGADDDWQKITVKDWCTDSPIKASGVANAKYATFVLREANGASSFRVDSAKRVKKACKYNECKNGFVARDNKCVNPDAEDCERTANAKWSGSSCICQETGRYWDKSKRYCATEEECRTGQFACLGINITVDNSTSVTTGDVTQQQQQQQKQDSDNTNTGGNNAGGNNGGSRTGGGSSCLSRPTENGRACCRAGNTTKYDKATDTCTCVDTSKEWKREGEYGACYTKGQTVTVNPCDTVCDTYINLNVKSSCAASSNQSIIATIESQCQVANRANCNVAEVQKLVSQIEIAINNCSVKPVVEDLAETTKRINSNLTSVEKRFGNLDVSVWKTAEGDFNTARLASDSIAGVVLGTTGALITSNVVKKNQIKSGFEDIVCTVGGQTVGSYGDEITVGIQ